MHLPVESGLRDSQSIAAKAGLILKYNLASVAAYMKWDLRML